MLTRILHNSHPFHSFVNELGLDLTFPQRQHMLNMEGSSLQRLMHFAVFTPSDCTRRNELTRLICHDLSNLRFAAK